MWTDEIVDEIHKIREEYARSFSYDLSAIFADLQRKQAEGGRKTVNLSRGHNPVNRRSSQSSNVDKAIKDTA